MAKPEQSKPVKPVKVPGPFNVILKTLDGPKGAVDLEVSWTPSKDAETYDVYVNDALHASGVVELSATLENIAGLTLSVYVVARNSAGFTQSKKMITVAPEVSDTSVDEYIAKSFPSLEEAKEVWNRLFVELSVRYGREVTGDRIAIMAVTDFRNWLDNYDKLERDYDAVRSGRVRVLKFPRGRLPKEKAI